METHGSDIKRRRLMQAGGVLAGLAAVGPWSLARAQSTQRIVLGTWGGDYSRLLPKTLAPPLLVPKKHGVGHDVGGDPELRAKMRAEARLPRGTSDLQGLSAAQMYEMNDAGLCLPVDYAKIPNAQNLLPQMKYPYGVGHIYSGKVILYNPKLISTPPTSFADALNSKHGNKLGIIDIQYQFTMMAAALGSGGSMTNYEPGKERLMACRKAGAKILPTNEQWQKAGAKVETVAPNEGVPLYISGFVIPKNAPNKDAAHVWLNAMLEPPAQEAFAEDMGYNATVINARIPLDTEKRIGFNADERKRLIDLVASPSGTKLSRLSIPRRKAAR